MSTSDWGRCEDFLDLVGDSKSLTQNIEASSVCRWHDRRIQPPSLLQESVPGTFKTKSQTGTCLHYLTYNFRAQCWIQVYVCVDAVMSGIHTRNNQFKKWFQEGKMKEGDTRKDNQRLIPGRSSGFQCQEKISNIRTEFISSREDWYDTR